MAHQAFVEPDAPVSLGRRPRILVVKLATLGDLLLTTPAQRGLRARYPEGRLDVLTTPSSAPLLTSSPLVDNVYTLRASVVHGYRKALAQCSRVASDARRLLTLRQNHYDALVLAHHLTLPSGRWKHRALVTAIKPRLAVGLDNGHGAWLDVRVTDDGFGARHEADYVLSLVCALDAHVTLADRRLDVADLGWSDLLRTAGHHRDAPRVALHPGSGLYSVARRWPIESYAELARRLHENTAATVVLIARQEERALADQLLALLGHPEWATVQPGGKTPRHLAETLAGCDLLVGNDSFPMHLAVALKVPTVAVFGPTNVRAWGPYAPGAGVAVAVRRGDLPCSPCVYRGHALGTPQGCPTRPCLTQLPVSSVLPVALRLLSQRSARVSPAG